MKDSTLRSLFYRHIRKSDGTSTVEFVIWLPILLIVIAIAADAALIFGAKAQILRIIQDVNRAASIGAFPTEAERVAFVRTSMGIYAANATVTSTLTNNNTVVSTTVVIPTSDLTATGLLGRLSNIQMTINAQHLLEA